MATKMIPNAITLLENGSTPGDGYHAETCSVCKRTFSVPDAGGNYNGKFICPDCTAAAQNATTQEPSKDEDLKDALLSK